MTLGKFEPGIGNTKAFDPVAKIQMSYFTSIPLEVVTILSVSYTHLTLPTKA